MIGFSALEDAEMTAIQSKDPQHAWQRPTTPRFPGAPERAPGSLSVSKFEADSYRVNTINNVGGDSTSGEGAPNLVEGVSGG